MQVEGVTQTEQKGCVGGGGLDELAAPMGSSPALISCPPGPSSGRGTDAVLGPVANGSEPKPGVVFLTPV